MIPKVIHYCWFGGKPLPKDAEKCIKSWREYLPDYEIKRWDESNFDVNAISYTKEAYAAGKYAFVSDYARFWILYNYGGVYFDTDVEIIKPLQDILELGPYFGVEHYERDEISVNPGLGFSALPKMGAIKELLQIYETLHFYDSAGNVLMKNIVEITTEYLQTKGLTSVDKIQECSGFRIYPVDFFCPISFETRQLQITDNTRTIHHFAESWVPKSTKFKNAIARLFGQDFLKILVKIKHFLKKK